MQKNVMVDAIKRLGEVKENTDCGNDYTGQQFFTF